MRTFARLIFLSKVALSTASPPYSLAQKEQEFQINICPETSVFQHTKFKLALHLPPWHQNSMETSGHGLEKSFSTSVLLTFQAGQFFDVGDGPGHCRIFSSFLGLYSLDASRTPSLTVTTKMSLDIVKCPWGAKSSPCWKPQVWRSQSKWVGNPIKSSSRAWPPPTILTSPSATTFLLVFHPKAGHTLSPPPSIC